MNKFKIFSLALVATTIAKAQDLEPAKKAIDAEQFEKAKSLLKSVIQAKPSNGKAAFLLGTIYLKQNISDSASIYFQKGLLASEGARLNNIGQGQLDLDDNNKTAAQAKFDLVIKELKKKDTEEYVYIARAFMNADKPDYKSAIAVLTKAATANPNDAQVQLALGDAYYGDKNQNDSYRAYLNAFQFDATDCPDLFPPLVALASYCDGVCEIKGVNRLAHKESDRGLTLQAEFAKMGVNIILSGDVMQIHGGSEIKSAIVFSQHDHRIAMACAVAALCANGPVEITEAEAINKSYTDFFTDLQHLGAKVDIE